MVSTTMQKASLVSRVTNAPNYWFSLIASFNTANNQLPWNLFELDYSETFYLQIAVRKLYLALKSGKEVFKKFTAF